MVWASFYEPSRIDGTELLQKKSPAEAGQGKEWNVS